MVWPWLLASRQKKTFAMQQLKKQFIAKQQSVVTYSYHVKVQQVLPSWWRKQRECHEIIGDSLHRVFLALHRVGRHLFTYSYNKQTVGLTKCATQLPGIPQRTNTHITRRRSWDCISLPSEFLQTLPVPKNLRDHVQTVPGNMHVYLKSVALTVFELLASNEQKFRGSRDPSHAPFSENFKRSCPGRPWEHARQIWSP